MSFNFWILAIKVQLSFIYPSTISDHVHKWVPQTERLLCILDQILVCYFFQWPYPYTILGIQTGLTALIQVTMWLSYWTRLIQLQKFSINLKIWPIFTKILQKCNKMTKKKKNPTTQVYTFPLPQA